MADLAFRVQAVIKTEMDIWQMCSTPEPKPRELNGRESLFKRQEDSRSLLSISGQDAEAGRREPRREESNIPAGVADLGSRLAQSPSRKGKRSTPDL
jgi:hypothetical protein